MVELSERMNDLPPSSGNSLGEGDCDRTPCNSRHRRIPSWHILEGQIPPCDESMLPWDEAYSSTTAASLRCDSEAGTLGGRDAGESCSTSCSEETGLKITRAARMLALAASARDDAPALGSAATVEKRNVRIHPSLTCLS